MKTSLGASLDKEERVPESSPTLAHVIGSDVSKPTSWGPQGLNFLMKPWISPGLRWCFRAAGHHELEGKWYHVQIRTRVSVSSSQNFKFYVICLPRQASSCVTFINSSKYLCKCSGGPWMERVQLRWEKGEFFKFFSICFAWSESIEPSPLQKQGFLDELPFGIRFGLLWQQWSALN